MDVTLAAPVSRLPFAEFYEQNWPDLSSYCRSFYGLAYAADDVAQEAFTRVYARYPLLREPRPYLFRTARNLLTEAARARRRDAALLASVAPPPVLPPADAGVLDAVHRLPAPLRDVVLLHYYADLPVEEVARALRRPAGTVKRRLHEARQRLAADLGEDLS